MPGLHIKRNINRKYFLTLTVLEWIDIFTKEDYFAALSESLNFCIANKCLIVNGYVFMINHIHLLVDTKEEKYLADIIRDFKRHTTREIVNLIKQDNRSYIRRLLYKSFRKKGRNQLQIWQPSNWAEVVESSWFFEQKLEYIHDNPVMKGYVNDPCEWRYSSAKEYYLGEKGPVMVTVE